MGIPDRRFGGVVICVQLARVTTVVQGVVVGDGPPGVGVVVGVEPLVLTTGVEAGMSEAGRDPLLPGTMGVMTMD